MDQYGYGPVHPPEVFDVFECQVINAVIPAEFADVLPLEIGKGVECELSENELENTRLCEEAGFSDNGDFGADRYDMKLTKSDQNGPIAMRDISHQEFIPNLATFDEIDASVVIGLEPGFTYSLQEIQAVALNGSSFPVNNNVPLGCTLEQEPGISPVGSIDLGDEIICVSMNDACINGLEVTEFSTELECEVSNAVIPAELADAIPLGIEKGVECELSEDEIENGLICTAVGVFDGGNLGADRYDMKLTQSDQNGPVDMREVSHEEFLTDPTTVNEADASVIVGVQPGFTYSLEEEQLVLLDDTLIPVIPAENNPPTGCQALIEPPGIGEDPQVVVGSIPEIPDNLDLDNPAVGFDVGICVIMNEPCVDGLFIDQNTVEPECEVANIVVPAEFIDAVPVGIDKGVECELSEDPNTNDQQCAAIGAVTGGDLGADKFDMELDGPSTILVDNTQFVNIIDPEAVEASATVGVDMLNFGTYTLSEIQLDTTEQVPVTQVGNNPPPIGCSALLEEPGFAVTGFISNLPDTLDSDVIGIDVGICVIMDTTCGVDGLLVNENTIEPECEVSNAIVPAEFIDAVPLGIDKGVECELSEDPNTNDQQCAAIGAVSGGNGDLGADRFDMELTDSLNNEIPVPHTAFVNILDDPAAIEAAALVGVDFETYTLTEEQLVLLDNSTVPVIPTDPFNPPIGCNALLEEPGFAITGVIPNLPDSVDIDNVGFDVGICVIMDTTCGVDGLLVNENTIEPECEVRQCNSSSRIHRCSSIGN